MYFKFFLLVGDETFFVLQDGIFLFFPSQRHDLKLQDVEEIFFSSSLNFSSLKQCEKPFNPNSDSSLIVNIVFVYLLAVYLSKILMIKVKKRKKKRERGKSGGGKRLGI